MKIGIDYSAAISKQRSGIGNYVFNLVSGIRKFDNINEYFLFVNAKLSFDVGFNFKIYQKTGLARCFKRLDVFHGPDFKLIFTQSRRKVVTIHDLASHFNDDFMSINFQELTKKKIRNSARKSDLIITPSNTVKSQLEEFYPETIGKIHTVYHGISDNIKTVNETEQIRKTLKKYKINQPYLLFVGNIENRKNILNLLNAFRELINERKTGHQLVLVGKPGWGFDKICMKAKELNLPNKICFIGWADENELSALYSAADVFVYPSWYEGFGFPILEAMKCKLPVVVSDIPTHREIASDAASFVVPDNPSMIAEAIYSLISNRSRCDLLISRGLERVKFFTWEKTAKETLKIYSSLLC